MVKNVYKNTGLACYHHADTMDAFLRAKDGSNVAVHKVFLSNSSMVLKLLLTCLLKPVVDIDRSERL